MAGKRLFATLLLAAGLSASCATPSPATEGETVETHETMTHWINRASDAIWTVRSDARSDAEGLDPTLMREADWTQLHEAARSLEIHSRRMAEAQSIRVGAREADTAGFASGSEIQARIDADPASFRKTALELAEHANDLGAAAKDRNARLARDLIETTGEFCQACHSRYWVKAGP